MGFKKTITHLDDSEVTPSPLSASAANTFRCQHMLPPRPRPRPPPLSCPFGCRLQVLLSASGTTRPFQTRVIEDEGMPVHNFPSESGNLRVTYNVIFPDALTQAQKKVVREVL